MDKWMVGRWHVWGPASFQVLLLYVSFSGGVFVTCTLMFSNVRYIFIPTFTIYKLNHSCRWRYQLHWLSGNVGISVPSFMKTPLISPVPKVMVTTSRSPLSGTCGQGRCWWVIFGSPRFFREKITHTIHGTGIFPYIWLIFIVNVGKYNHTWILWDLVKDDYQMIETVTFLGWSSDLQLGYQQVIATETKSSPLKSDRNPKGSRIVWTNHPFFRGELLNFQGVPNDLSHDLLGWWVHVGCKPDQPNDRVSTGYGLNPLVGGGLIPFEKYVQVHLDHETPRIGVKIKHILMKLRVKNDPDEYFQNILDLEFFEKNHDNGFSYPTRAPLRYGGWALPKCPLIHNRFREG